MTGKHVGAIFGEWETDKDSSLVNSASAQSEPVSRLAGKRDTPIDTVGDFAAFNPGHS